MPLGFEDKLVNACVMADAIAPGLRELLIPEFARIIGNGETATYRTLLVELVPAEDLREKLVRIWYDLFRASSLRTAEASTVAGAGYTDLRCLAARR
jgi:hypothetical protein